MSFPPDSALKACLTLLYHVTIEARLLGWEGERDDLAKERCKQVADLMDAVHNVPWLAQRWEECDEQRLRDFLRGYDETWRPRARLLDVYDLANEDVKALPLSPLARPAPPVAVAPLQAAIEPLLESEFDPFSRYLDDHLRDNGLGSTGFFQPLPAGEGLPPAKAQSIRAGLGIPVGEPGWRRAWVARAPDGGIIGHVDLRGRPEPLTRHRCLLGMGVHRDFRRRGLGARLLGHVLGWSERQPGLEWVDLEVVSSNANAIRLYQRAGFVPVAQSEDFFRVAGQSLDFMAMARRVTTA